jgi:preprotein translocase subunit SecE
MAILQKDNRRPALEDEEEGEDLPGAEPKEDQAIVRADSKEDASITLANAPSEQEGEPDASEEEEEQAAGQLGVDRYVLAGFFASSMLATYILGRTIQGFWSSVSNKDWFNHAVPWLAAVGDDEKATYSFVVAGIISFIAAFRIYRKPEVRSWCDDVASELAKVVWPNKKEVSNSTIIVIVASTMATLYLALLDRLWAFVTNIVYGDGS